MSPLQLQLLLVVTTAVLAHTGNGSSNTTTIEARKSDDAVSLIFIMLGRFHCPLYSSCQKCITKETIKDILGGGNPRDHGTAAVLIALNANQICSHFGPNVENETSDTVCTNQSCIKEWTDDRGIVDKMKVETLLRDIGSKYTPATNTCVTSGEILSGLKSGNNNNSISSVTAAIWGHLIRGHCLKLATDPLDNILEHYGTTKASNGTKGPVLHKEEVKHLVTDINNIIPECTITSEDTFDKLGHSHSHRNRQSEQRHVDYFSGCLNAESLFVRSDHDISQTVDVNEFTSHLCPAIIEQLTKGSTRSVIRNRTNKNASIADGMTYLYGTAAITLISLCSLLGAVFIPTTKVSSNKRHYILTGLIAMGFGILVGDALIHLVPQALGLHGDHSENDQSEHGEGNHLSKCIVMMAAIYFLFLFEGVCQAIFPNNNDNAHGHSHSMDLTGNHGPSKKTISQQTLTSAAFDPGSAQGTVDIQIDETLAPLNQSPIVCCGLRNLALIVIVGDAIHNLADGLVIGAAFAASINGGIASSFAILCHELPHELGDFAILLSTGLSRRRAVIVNLISSLSSYVGFFIGVTIGSDESAIQWTMSITIGMFLFVALGDMMPELKSLRTRKPWTSLLLQNVAVLIGVGFTVLMAIYEKEIKIIS